MYVGWFDMMRQHIPEKSCYNPLLLYLEPFPVQIKFLWPPPDHWSLASRYLGTVSNSKQSRTYTMPICDMLLMSLSLIPLMNPVRSPTGIRYGKSKMASMSARNSHHTAMAVTNNVAPAACEGCQSRVRH